MHVYVVCVIQKIEKEYKKEYPFGYSFSFFFCFRLYPERYVKRELIEILSIIYAIKVRFRYLYPIATYIISIN